MPAKKSTKKETKKGKGVVKSANDVAPLPDLKKDAEPKKNGLPPLSKSPTIPPGGSKTTDDIVIPDGPPKTKVPDRDALQKSLEQMSGKTPSEATSSLAEEFMPLLAEKIDTLGHRLDVKFDEFSASLVKQVEKEKTATSKEFTALRKEFDAMRNMITVEVLPVLTRMEGVVAALNKKGGVTAVQVAVAQDEDEEMEAAESEDLEDAEPGESLISPGMEAAFAFYLGMENLRGQQYPVEVFAESVLNQALADPDTVVDPAVDTVENCAEYLESVAHVRDGILTIK